MEKQSQSSFASWLENLQRESWQLELLISGFAIFLLFQSIDPLTEYSNYLDHYIDSNAGDVFSRIDLIGSLIKVGWFFMIINLIIHLVMRALWIGALGLRSVSDDIDYSYLKLSPQFEKYLKRRVGSFDKYVELLDKISSVIFALSFLIVFMWFSIGLFVIVTGTFSLALGKIFSDKVSGYIVILFTITGLLYLFDFLTLSLLKRIKWKWFFYFYFPFYRIYGFITLAFLYRPLYYNLIDNKFGRRISWFFLPYVFLFPLALASKFTGHEYLPWPFEGQKKKVFLHENIYDDLRDDTDHIELAAIPKREIESSYLELFLVYEPEDNETIEYNCPDLEKINTKKIITPIEHVAVEKFSWGDKQTSNNINFQTYINCTGKLYEVHMDSTQIKLEQAHFYLHPKSNQIGLLTMIDVRALEKGKHNLHILKKR
ncbi:MAG: hypothetical protein AAFO07_11285, partial [Bacteroidota bacterium]